MIKQQEPSGPAITEEQLNEIKYDLGKQIPAFAKKLVKVYMLLGWEWQFKGGRRTPLTQEIEDTAIRLVDTLEPGEERAFASSGGIEASYRYYESGGYGYFEGKLTFDLSSTTSVEANKTQIA